jgi:outer membrane protein TolC
MSTPRVVLSRLTALLCVLALFSTSVLAQAPAQGTAGQPAQAEATVQAPSAAKTSPNAGAVFADYSKPVSAWTIIGPYKGRTVAPPNLTNTSRIDSLMRNGTIYLSLSDAIALALENNLDIAIARYNLNIADTDILRTRAGGVVAGVNTGLVSGTPGGNAIAAAGTGAGGTTGGTGGAGAGTLGIVSSTTGAGPSVDSFDPVFTANAGLENFQTPSTSTINPFNSGHITTANLGFQQGFQTGTLFTASFQNGRNSTVSRIVVSGPINQTALNLSSNFQVRLRQHLLSGLSFNDNPNTRFIRIAKNNRTITDASFKNQVTSTVSQIQNIYWDLVNAYEDLKVKQHSLELANRTLSDNKKQVEIGTLAPIEVVRAQSAVASADQDLIVSKTNLQYQQLLMINAITRNVSNNTLASAKVVPTDTMTFADEPVRPVEELITDALANRPELQQSRINLKNSEINRKGARNGLLPTLDLVGFYGGSGVASDFGSAFTDAYGGTNPDKGFAFQLVIPIRNRTAQATQIRSELEFRQSQMQLQQQENNVAISVRQAAYTVQQNRARVEATRAARELAAQSLDAEQKKFALGASTSFNVLQTQRDLIQAETNVVNAVTSYQKSRVELDRVTANTLERNNIYLADAVRGEVNHEPKVPGVVQATPAPTPQQ